MAATDERAATTVVQGYVAPVDPVVERPVRELKAWGKVVVEPGASAAVVLEFGPDAFHHWDESRGSWTVQPGEYDVVIARSSSPADEHARIRLTLT